jgi:hypothetical protein
LFKSFFPYIYNFSTELEKEIRKSSSSSRSVYASNLQSKFCLFPWYFSFLPLKFVSSTLSSLSLNDNPISVEYPNYGIIISLLPYLRELDNEDVHSLVLIDCFTEFIFKSHSSSSSNTTSNIIHFNPSRFYKISKNPVFLKIKEILSLSTSPSYFQSLREICLNNKISFVLYE